MNVSLITKLLDEKQPRGWQEDECERALDRLEQSPICVVEAVTGGGKTFFACYVAAQLIARKVIDEIVILSPNVDVKHGWAEEFAAFGIQCTSSDYRTEGVEAMAITYAGVFNEHIQEKIERRKKRLLIVDEFHHAERTAAWGDAVDYASQRSTKILMLSGTPWRSEGEIALLKKHGYYQANGTVKADVCYPYEKDLKAVGNDRGTVYANFLFLESHAKNVESGREITFKAPQNEELEAFADERNTEPLGPHVRIRDNRLSNNSMARAMLQSGVEKLGVSSRETKGKAIGLVVARNISEARSIADYLTESLGQRAEVIASDDDQAHTRLRQIRKEPRQTSPDWIVSVGMVSEGVNIPQIKVIVYLSAVITLLYLIQVIGRALRRINIGKGETPTYIDKHPGQTPGYIIMPAHPYLIWLASKFEESKKCAMQHRQSQEVDKEPNQERVEQDWTNSGGKNALEVFGGRAQEMRHSRMIELLQIDEDAKGVFNESIVSGVREWQRNGNHELVEKFLADLCDRFSISVPDQTFEDKLTCDQELALLRSEAHRTVAKIRFSHPNYRDVNKSLNDRIFKEIRGSINRKCGITSFDKATIEQKRRWVAIAQDIYTKGCVNGRN